jgi:hypothetical protein
LRSETRLEGGGGITDTAEEVFLEVELSGAGASCLDYLEDLEYCQLNVFLLPPSVEAAP